MIEAQATAVSGRRYLALLIDSAMVAAVGFGAAYLQSDAFTIVGRDDAGEPLIDPAEFDRMESLLDFEVFGQSEILGINLVRAQEIGDSLRVFGADSYRWGIVAAALAALVVFYTIPAVIQRTIGMMPFGLEIRDIEGGQATITAHLKRSAAGVIDMIPGIVPGLVGTIVASFSSHQQRIGDRVAGTVVVDRKLAAFHSREQRTTPLTLTVNEEIVTEPVDTAVAERADATEPEAAEASVELAALTDRIAAAESEDVVSSETASAEPAAAEAVAPTERTDEASEAATAPPPAPTHRDRLDDAPLPPPPVHRQPPSERPPAFNSASGNDTAASGNDTAASPGHPAPLAESPATSVHDAWERPRIEPAPVWQPATFDPAPVETPIDDERTISDVMTGQPTVAELISADPATPERRFDFQIEGEQEPPSPLAQPQTSSAEAPVWSEKWRAWMYWDPSKKRWLRHDTSTNEWIPAE